MTDAAHGASVFLGRGESPLPETLAGVLRVSVGVSVRECGRKQPSAGLQTFEAEEARCRTDEGQSGLHVSALAAHRQLGVERKVGRSPAISQDHDQRRDGSKGGQCIGPVRGQPSARIPHCIEHFQSPVGCDSATVAALAGRVPPLPPAPGETSALTVPAADSPSQDRAA